MMKNEIR